MSAPLPADERACRRFFLGTLTAAAAGWALLFAATTWLVDPYREAGAPEGPWNRRRYFYTPATARAVLARLDRGPAALVFGTDRARLISSELLGTPALNLFILDGDPRAAAAVLRGLDADRARNVTAVYFLLDLESFLSDLEYRPPPGFESPFGLREAGRGFGLDKLADAARTVAWNLSGAGDYWLHEDGHRVAVAEPVFDPRFADTKEDLSSRLRFSPRAAGGLAEVRAWAEGRGVPAVFFTLPVWQGLLARLDPAFLEATRRGVLRHVPEFWDLAWLPGVSDDPAAFHEASDLNAAGLERALEPLRRRDARFRVDARTLEDRLRALEKARAAAEGRHAL